MGARQDPCQLHRAGSHQLIMTDMIKEVPAGAWSRRCHGSLCAGLASRRRWRPWWPSGACRRRPTAQGKSSASTAAGPSVPDLSMPFAGRRRFYGQLLSAWCLLCLGTGIGYETWPCQICVVRLFFFFLKLSIYTVVELFVQQVHELLNISRRQSGGAQREQRQRAKSYAKAGWKQAVVLGRTERWASPCSMGRYSALLFLDILLPQVLRPLLMKSFSALFSRLSCNIERNKIPT
jgi:hypothetical protein